MKEINAYDFISLKRIIGCNNIEIYPTNKQFLEATTIELKFLCCYKVLSEISQVIVINKDTNIMTETIPVYELINSNFNYFKDAITKTNEQIDLKYKFVIYEDFRLLKKTLNQLKKLKKEV